MVYDGVKYCNSKPGTKISYEIDVCDNGYQYFPGSFGGGYCYKYNSPNKATKRACPPGTYYKGNLDPIKNKLCEPYYEYKADKLWL